MAWTLFNLVEIDIVKLAPVALKSAAGAIGGGAAGFLLKKVKGWIVGVSERCIIQGCGGAVAAGQREASARGLCLNCYSKAKQKIVTGITTWEELVNLGLAKGEESDPFNRAFNKAKDKGEK